MKKNKFLTSVLLGALLIGSLGFATSKNLSSSKKRSMSQSAYIGIERAKSIALKRVPGARITKIKLDYENGRPVYEGEMHKGGWEYEFDIDAVTGNIIKWEKDRD